MKRTWKVFGIIIIVMLIGLVAGCEEFFAERGGSIVVTNNTLEEIKVYVYHDYSTNGILYYYSDIDSATISAGDSHTFSVGSNCDYGVKCGDGGIRTYEVSNGKTVKISF